MAFQVADDLLDYTEDREMTGKPGGLDLREHKVTLPLIAAIPAMSPSQRQSVDTLFATPDPDDEAVNEVIAIVHELGGIEYARRRADEYAAEAERALAGVPAGPSRAALVDAISYVVERRW
jgi:octaprenyl-diphosphate synthase